MHILFIHNLWGKEARGGAEQVLLNIITYLRDQGHTVTLVTTTVEVKMWVEKEPGLTIYYLPSAYSKLSTWPRWRRFFYHLFQVIDITTYARIKNIIAREKPDVIWTHNLLGLGFRNLWLGKACGLKHIHTLHDIQLLHPSGLLLYGQESMIKNLPARLYQWFIKAYISPETTIISPSHWLLALYEKEGFFLKNKKLVLPNPLVASSRITESYTGVNTNQQNITFLYVGQMEEHKGVSFLLDAFIKTANPQWRLIIVGDGQLFTQLKIKVKDDRISFMGRQDHNMVKELMKTTHCLVVPSLCYENFPTVILEAMSVSLPVIGTNLGGIKELLENEVLLFNPDIESIQQKIEWAGQSYQELLELTQARYNNIITITPAEYCQRLGLEN